MPSEGLRRWLVLLSILGLAIGCAGVPAAPKPVQQQTTSDDKYDGWLFNSLTGHKTAAADAPQAPSSTAPATDPATGAPSPLVPVPTTASASRIPTAAGMDPGVIPAGATTAAGPPPSIPDELPRSPMGVSVDDIKPKTEKKKGFEMSDLAPENVYKSIKGSLGYGPDEKIARAAKQEGEALFREKKYKEAAAKFSTAADRWPDSPLEEDALLLKGESEFFSDQYPAADDTFGGLLKKYPTTRHLDTVLWREYAIAKYWDQMQTAKPMWTIAPNMTDDSRPTFDTFGRAVKAYERIHQYDPRSPLAAASLMALGNAYFRNDQFEYAAEKYDTLMKEYPDSRYIIPAHKLGLQATIRVYQGKDYDDSALLRAQKIAERALNQFGDKLGNEREAMVRDRAKIIEEQANRYFARAQYYEGRHYYGAARFYYKCILDEYANTQMAKEAKVAMAKIGSEPNEPPPRFAWLTDMFSTTKTR